MKTYFNVEYIQQIAVATLDAPGTGVNLVNQPMLEELDELLDDLDRRCVSADPRIRPRGLVIVSGKEDGFLAGADLQMLREFQNEGGVAAYKAAQEGKRVFSKLRKLPIPTVAAIHGSCLGGGAELALACKYRVGAFNPEPATIPPAKIGFPEINLQLIPGLGGTVRLPGLVGLTAALDLVLTGRTLETSKAWEIGLIDELAPGEEIIEAALRICLEENPRRFYRKNSGFSLSLKATHLANSTKAGRKLILSQARKRVRKETGGKYPAPIAALDVMERLETMSEEQALEYESYRFGQLVNSNSSRYFLDFFSGQRRAKSLTQRPSNDAEESTSQSQMRAPGTWCPPTEIRTVGIVGSGFMGTGIAQLAAYSGLKVIIKGRRESQLAEALAGIEKLFQSLVAKRKISEKQARAYLSDISLTTDYDALKECDLIIEAIAESMEAKQKLIADLDRAMGGKPYIFASNTSALSIGEMASVAINPESVVGLHFFSPVYKMKLVEVIGCTGTSLDALRLAVDFVEGIKRVPVLVKDSPGFLVNRILAPYMLEAMRLVQEGISPLLIDRAMTELGMPVGPLTLIDEVGIDIAAHVVETLRNAFGDRMQPPSFLPLLVEGGIIGRKAGLGIYLYDGKNGRRLRDKKTKQYQVNPTVLVLSGCLELKMSKGQIQDRLLGVMINESARCMREGIVSSPAELDLAMVFGTGFPAYTGGPLRYADSIGASTLCQTLRRMELSAGANYKPCDLLESMCQQNWRRFLPDSISHNFRADRFYVSQ